MVKWARAELLEELLRFTEKAKDAQNQFANAAKFVPGGHKKTLSVGTVSDNGYSSSGSSNIDDTTPLTDYSPFGSANVLHGTRSDNDIDDDGVTFSHDE
jgi:hypothetical protein